MKELLYFAQLTESGKFQKFDYGEENMQHYGQDTAPELDISRINQVPIGMFVGMQDVAANYLDNRWVKSQIKSGVHYQEIDNCDHGTFANGNDMSYFKDVLKLIK